MKLTVRKTSYRAAFIAVLALGIVVIAFASPVSAAGTTWINVTKYADNNYSLVTDWANLTWEDMRNLSSVYSNGPVYMDGPTFDPGDPYGSSNPIIFYDHNGTYVSDLVDEVDGMDPGDELKIQARDNFALYFGEDDVYSPEEGQGDMIISWWDSEMGEVPGYSYGMRLFFYTPAPSYGVNDCLNLTLAEMRDNFDPWYQHNYTDYSGSWPSAKGLSAKYVQYLKIYPPHRYDFNTTGDTTEWAYEGGVGASPGQNDPSGTTVVTSLIADDDNNYEQTISTTTGEYAAQRFVFNVTEDAAKMEKLAFTWDGTSSHDDSSSDQGSTTYIWKDGTGYEALTGDITSDIDHYVVTGNVTVLVKQNAAQFYDDEDEEDKYSHLGTDYANLVVTHHHTN